MTTALPAVHVRNMLALLEQWDVPTQRVVAELGLDQAALEQPDAYVSLADFQRLSRRAQELSGASGASIGILLGSQMRISAYGFVGFAALSAPTLRDAFSIAVRFAPMLSEMLSLRLEESTETASLVLAEGADLGAARELILSALVVGFARMSAALTGAPLGAALQLGFPAPQDVARVRHLLPERAHFAGADTRLVLPRVALGLPLLQAEPSAERLAREHCERALQAVATESSLADRVRRMLASEERTFLSVGQVAHRLHLSERTLKRKLMRESTSFLELLESERRQRATVLLRSTQLSVEQVADRLGYSEQGNFARAFRRWTGSSPRRFRAAAG